MQELWEDNPFRFGRAAYNRSRAAGKENEDEGADEFGDVLFEWLYFISFLDLNILNYIILFSKKQYKRFEILKKSVVIFYI